jgi:NAD(P)-dependent dehydrogenase (short-subunit alcohol dehydrogenase family)
MNTQQKVAIVTGASQGIGASLVQAFRDRGYRVIANSRSIKASNDPDIHVVAGDIADPAVAQRIVREGLEKFGRIDTLVNNAGVFIAKPFTQYTAEDYASAIATTSAGSSTSRRRAR